MAGLLTLLALGAVLVGVLTVLVGLRALGIRQREGRYGTLLAADELPDRGPRLRSQRYAIAGRRTSFAAWRAGRSCRWRSRVAMLPLAVRSRRTGSRCGPTVSWSRRPRGLRPRSESSDTATGESSGCRGTGAPGSSSSPCGPRSTGPTMAGRAPLLRSARVVGGGTSATDGPTRDVGTGGGSAGRRTRWSRRYVEHAASSRPRVGRQDSPGPSPRPAGGPGAVALG